MTLTWSWRTWSKWLKSLGCEPRMIQFSQTFRVSPEKGKHLGQTRWKIWSWWGWWFQDWEARNVRRYLVSIPGGSPMGRHPVLCPVAKQAVASPSHKVVSRDSQGCWPTWVQFSSFNFGQRIQSITDNWIKPVTDWYFGIFGHVGN